MLLCVELVLLWSLIVEMLYRTELFFILAFVVKFLFSSLPSFVFILCLVGSSLLTACGRRLELGMCREHSLRPAAIVAHLSFHFLFSTL